MTFIRLSDKKAGGLKKSEFIPSMMYFDSIQVGDMILARG